MSEFLSQSNPEQLILGGTLAIIKDYQLDFAAGELEQADTEEMISDITTALLEIGEDDEEVTKDYGVLEEDDNEV